MNYAFCIKFRCTTLIEHCKGNTKVFISPNNLAENVHSLTSFNFAAHPIVATLLYLCAGKMPAAPKITFVTFLTLFVTKVIFRPFKNRENLGASLPYARNNAKKHKKCQCSETQGVGIFLFRKSTNKTAKPTTKSRVKDLLLPPDRATFTQQKTYDCEVKDLLLPPKLRIES